MSPIPLSGLDKTEHTAKSYLRQREMFPNAPIGFSWWPAAEQARCRIVLNEGGSFRKHGWLSVGYTYGDSR